MISAFDFALLFAIVCLAGAIGWIFISIEMWNVHEGHAQRQLASAMSGFLVVALLLGVALWQMSGK